MKTVILCGGLGSRLSEETGLVPKPMVTVGGIPMLLHIMNIYGSQGHSDFVLALGYKARVIKEYFLNYFELNSDFTVELGSGKVSFADAHSRNDSEDSKMNWYRNGQKNWQSQASVSLFDTGELTMTGGRLKRLEPVLRPSGTFMLTYGDGLSDVDLKKLLNFHRSHGKCVTVTSVRPAARFGGMELNSSGQVSRFVEKPTTGEGWINGGFFVMEPRVFDYLKGGPGQTLDETILERHPLEALVRDGELMAYAHDGFWQCMDTVRDRQLLEELWRKPPRAPWVF